MLPTKEIHLRIRSMRTGITRPLFQPSLPYRSIGLE